MAEQSQQPSLITLDDFPPILLLQDPRFNYILRYHVLRHPHDEGSFLLHCHFDNISPQARAQLGYRLRVYRFGKQEQRLVEGPLTMKGEMSIWPGDQGTLEILLGTKVHNRIVFTVREDGGITHGKGTTIDVLNESERTENTGTGEAGGQDFAPGTLGSCLQALLEELLEQTCERCKTRHPRYLIVGGGLQQAYPFEALTYHRHLEGGEQWLHHPCVQREALLRHPDREVVYGYVVDLTELWGERCPPPEAPEAGP